MTDEPEIHDPGMSGGLRGSGYDHWKTTNPADEWLGPEPEDEMPDDQALQDIAGDPDIIDAVNFADAFQKSLKDKP